jgi:hypothetical protein
MWPLIAIAFIDDEPRNFGGFETGGMKVLRCRDQQTVCRLRACLLASRETVLAVSLQTPAAPVPG